MHIKEINMEKRIKIFTINEDKEVVNHPDHYNSGKIETIDAIEDWGFGQGFNLGNAIKYISRANHKKNCVEDLKKASWYINREIERLEKETQSETVVKVVGGEPLNVDSPIVTILDTHLTDTSQEYNSVSTVCNLEDVDDDCNIYKTKTTDVLGREYQFPKLTPDMLDRLNEWYKNHNGGKCGCTSSGAIGGSITFSVTPTSIGDFVTALCPLCEEEFNIGEEL
jgi:hypothetical protein